MSAPTDAASLLPGLKRGVAEHRILLWSARGAEQQDLTGRNWRGLLPAADGTEPTVGVYRNDGTGGKLGYYASGSAALTSGPAVRAAGEHSS